MRVWASILATLAFVALTGASAHADSILARRYTSAKLDALWQGTLGSSPPEAARFVMLAPDSATPAPVADVPPNDIGVPFTGTIMGESAGAGGAQQAHNFPVIPMAAEDASVLIRRLAWAEVYLTRDRFYTAVSTDSSAVLETITERQGAAALEIYLITARLYFAAPDLQQKCRHLTRMAELAKGPLSGGAGLQVPDGWKSLLPIETAAAAILGSDTLAKLVCSVEPVRGRAETVKLVETRVRERIMREVRAKVTETLQLLNASSTAFQTLVNDMNVQILSAEIMELERVLGNASANMVLVKEDQLKAADTIATLKAVDLSTLNQPEALKEFEDGKTRMAAMTEEIDGVMGAMADLAAVTNDPAISVELAPCTNLRGAYPALDLNLDSGTLSQAIEGPYEDCIARARVVVEQFQAPSLKKAWMAELARRVRQISETYLTTVSP